MAHMKNRDSNRRRREDRQVQAKVRQEAHDALTVEQKIAKLGSLPAVKERAKLAMIQAAKTIAKAVETEVFKTEEKPKRKKGKKNA